MVISIAISVFGSISISISVLHVFQ